MTQKTIKALYKQPVNYKLTKDGYKTINGVIQAQDGMPKVVDLSVPSELYTTDLQYNVNTEVNGAPIITTSQFTLPDNEICEAKTYCYAPKGINYNYTEKQKVIHKYLDTTTYTVNGSPTINTSSGIITNFYSSNNINIGRLNFTNKFELYAKIYCTTHASKFWFSSLIGGSGCPGIGTDSNGYMRFYNGSNYEVGYFNLNTWYWVYFVQENSTSKLYYIQDNGYELDTLPNINQWSIGPSIGSNLFSSSYGFKIGTNTNYSSEYWSGSVDLSGFLIKADGQIAWKPFVKETRVEETVVPIPGILDSSVTIDNWQQNQEYKLYQLKNQNNTDSLQLTENSITDTTQKYKQYINQLIIPARDYKWYYHYNVEAGVYDNYTVIGSPTINTSTGVVSGFSSSNYLQLPQAFNPGNNPWEMIFRVKTSSDFSDLKNDIIGSNTQSNYQAINCGVSKDHLFNLGISVNGSSGDPGYGYGTYYVLPETWYYIKIQFTGSHYQLYYSLDGNNYILDIDTISSLPVYQNNTPYLIGLNKWSTDSNSWYPWTGTIDLSESYIKINGNIWWSPMSTKDKYKWMANKSIYDYSATGLYADTLDFAKSYVGVNDSEYHKYVNPKVCLMPIDGGETKTVYSLNATEIGNTNFDIYTGISNRFSSADYLQLPQAFNPGNNSWEMIIKIRTGSDLQAWQEIFHSSVTPDDSGCYGISVIVDSGNFELDISTDGSSWIGSDHGTFVLSENTDYWVKIGWNSNEYYLEYSTNGVDYTRDITYASSNNLPNLTNSWIGIYRNSNYMYPMLGSIDLSESYIKINDEIWWNGTSITGIQNNIYKIKEVVQTNYDDLSKLPSTLIDGRNFELNGSTFRNGLASYQVASYGYSYGYFTYTPSKTQTISIKASVSSESGCDYGACYIGTRQYKASFDAVRNGNTDGYGSWLFSISGEVSTTTYTYTLQKGVTYYIEFYYAKDQSANTGNDRFVVSELSGFVSEVEKVTFLPGCLYNYNDDGSEHSFDVYYDSNYTQPILVSAGESYSEGTKVDTITIPAHKTWNYQADGNWSPISYVDVTTSNYTYEDGNLVLTEYTGNETDVTLPNAVL